MNRITSINPATGETVWEGEAATTEDVNNAIASARNAFPEWSQLPIEKRIEHLHHYRLNLENSRQKLAEAISNEMGKPLWESLGEVEAMRNKIGISIDAYQQRCKELIHQTSHATSITRHQPHGVVAILGPFNFPGHLPNGHIVPALLAGNTIVFKPSEHTPLVGEILSDCLELPQGVFNLVQGARETGSDLAFHPDINGLFFTGSWNTGKILSEHFSKYPGKILALEMGGNNPLVVWDVNDIKAAAYLIIQSAFLTSGQRCTCARRLIISKKDEELIPFLQEMIGGIKIGAWDEKPEPFMGPVISEQAAKHLLEVQQNLGGEILLKMQHFRKNTGFITPGIIDVTSVTTKDEEYFGPLLQVIRVNSFDQAIEVANHTEYGLAAGLISDNASYYEKFRHSVRAGVINWNTQLTGASSTAPFGGVGKSGNFRPSAYYAADYCAYPVASMETPLPKLPEKIPPGIKI